jgi:AcrR family transcriptional regulator
LTIKVKKESWFEAGLWLLTGTGPHSLTIDNLCRKLGVTKGSFYHHFRNRPAYIEQLWEYWEQENTTRLVDATRGNDIDERLDILLKLVYQVPRERELALRALALYDATSRAFQEKIDRERKGLLEEINRNFFGDREEVKVISSIDYAWYLGTQLMIPSLDNEELNKVIEGYQQMKRAYLQTTVKERGHEPGK